ncbi:MAG: Smr/MutS family protein [Clostridia bacterium]|nr:Smr/MutS family protein [Clostridia bacterium]
MDNEFLYGNIKKVDLHGYSREEALSLMLHEVFIADNTIDGIEFIHGYHGGRVLKDLVRKEFSSDRVEKIVCIDASRTIYKIKKQ